jgi:hypothetical protein
MPLTFTYEKYPNMHFLYRFCNGNGGDAIAEYHQCFPNQQVTQQNVLYNTHGIMRD